MRKQYTQAITHLSTRHIYIKIIFKDFSVPPIEYSSNYRFIIIIIIVFYLITHIMQLFMFNAT